MKAGNARMKLADGITSLKLKRGERLLVKNNGGEWIHVDKEGAGLLNKLVNGENISANEIDRGGREYLNTLLRYKFITNKNHSRTNQLKLPSLLSLHVEITNRCNLKCKHCYLSSGKSKANELRKDQVMHLIDTVVKMGGEKISFSGGEPFLISWLPEVCEYAVRRKLDTYVFTNGTCFNDRTVAMLKKTGKIKTQISMEGVDSKTHDWIRGRGNSEKIKRGIDKLCRAGLKENIVLFVTINKKNIGQLKEIIEYAAERGIKKVRFTQINKQGRAIAGWKDMNTTGKQWIEYGKTMEGIFRKYPQMQILGNIYGGLKFAEGEFPRMSCECGMEPRIDCQGNVYPCQMFVSPQFILGNINENELGHIIRGKKLVELKKTIEMRSQNNKKCQKCTYQELCNSGCPGHAESQYGDINHEDNLCEPRLFWFAEYSRRYTSDKG